MDYGQQADDLLETVEHRRGLGTSGLTTDGLVQLAQVYALRDIGSQLGDLVAQGRRKEIQGDL